MVKFIKKVLLFFVLIAIIDIVCGIGFKFLRVHAKAGDTQKNYYISEKCNDDILILGSSRAARHYDPKVFEDSLALSCYNCGEPGCGIITAFARYKMIEERHKPKLVIYEVTPGYDYYRIDDYSKYLGRLRQYSDKKSVKELYNCFGDDLDKLRLLSNLYRNNSAIIHNILDLFISEYYYRGYMPLYGRLNDNAISQNNRVDYCNLDTLMLSYMERLIIKCQQDHTSLCFVASPRYLSETEAQIQMWKYEPIMRLCKKYDVPFLNNIFIPNLSDDRHLFHDFVHLNETGARTYSGKICTQIRQDIKIKK